MVYFKDNEILIRDMIQSDAQIITDEEIAQGGHQTIEKYEMRLQHQAQGKSFALIAEYKGNVAGYRYFDWRTGYYGRSWNAAEGHNNGYAWTCQIRESYQGEYNHR